MSRRERQRHRTMWRRAREERWRLVNPMWDEIARVLATPCPLPMTCYVPGTGELTREMVERAIMPAMVERAIMPAKPDEP